MKKILFILVLSGCFVSLSAQWHFHNPLPQGNTLRDVYFFNAYDGLAVGDGGTLLRTADAGASWETVPLPAKFDCYGIHFIGMHVGFICGSNGMVLRTSDGGNSWQQATTNTNVTLRDVHFVSSPRGLAVGDYGAILITLDCGVTWTPLNSNSSSTLHSVFCLDPLEAVAVGDNGTILHSSDGGSTWDIQQSNTTEPLYRVIFRDGYRGWIAGNAGIIMKTVNTGQTWLLQESGTELSLHGICFCNESQGWAVGMNGTILKTIDAGEHWISQQSNSDRELMAVCPVNEQKCFVVGNNGEQIYTTDGGKEWISENSGFYDPANLNFAGFTDDMNGWACGRAGKIARTQDAGITWAASGDIQGSYDLVFTDSQHGWLVNGSYYIQSTEDGGQTWQVNPYMSEDDEYFNNLFFVNPDTGWVGGVGYFEGQWDYTMKYVILKTTNGGQSWSKKIISQPVSGSFWTEMEDLFFLDKSRGWAIGISWRFAGDWEEYFKVEVLKTVNGGTSWSLVQTSLSPFDWFSGGKIYFSDNTTGYAITLWSSTMYRSINSGATWTDIYTGAYLNDFYFSDHDHGLAVGSGGTILQTTDAGISWAPQFSPTAYGLNRILFTPAGDGWIFGENSVILHWADTTAVAVKEPGQGPDMKCSAFPNPFSNSTSLAYDLETDCGVSLKIYNSSGQLFTELVNEQQKKGQQQVTWHAEGMPSGIYFYRLSAGNTCTTGKLVLMR